MKKQAMKATTAIAMAAVAASSVAAPVAQVVQATDEAANYDEAKTNLEKAQT